MSKKKSIRTALALYCIAFLVITILPMPSMAHPPSGMQLEYDINTQKLNVTITHNTGNPNSHYIFKVTVKRNNDLVIDKQYTSQPTSSSFTYTYDVTALDGDVLEAYAECNQGGSQTRQLTVVEPDVTQPSITITEPVESEIFTSDSIYVNGTAMDNKDISKVEVKINDGNWMQATGTSAWSIEVILGEGQNAIQAKAIDTSDNEATDVVNVTYNQPVDSTPPVIVISSPMEGQVFHTDNITVAGTALDDVALDRIEVRLNDDPWRLASGTISWNMDITLTEGNNTIHARAMDMSGNNVTRSVSVRFDSTTPVDNIPPTIIISFPAEGQELGSSNVTVQGNASDNEGLAKVEVSVNDGEWQLCDGLGSWNTKIILEEGSNEITARATDTSGNMAADSVNLTLTLADAAPPVISITSHENDETVNIPNITLSGTATDDVLLSNVEVSVNDGGWQLCEGLGSWNTDIALDEGSNKIVARATDTYGNTAVDYVNLTYNLADELAPDITITSHGDDEVVNISNVTISGTATDNVLLSRVEVRLNNGPWIVSTGLRNWTMQLSLMKGDNLIQAKATDASENNGTVTINLVFEGIGSPVNGATLDGVIEEGEYDFEASFNGGKFIIYWRTAGDHIFMAISAQTTGWVSLGIDPTVKMKDADMMIGWVSHSGEVHLLDCYSTGDYGPHPPDTTLGGTDDILQYGGSEGDGRTILEFKRSLVTGDEYDKEFKLDSSMEIIWAVGDNDDYTSGHGGERGGGTLKLLTGESTERDIPYLWPYHALAMSLGFALMICGVITARFFRKKRWWMKAHKALGGIAAVSVIAGLIISVIMVSKSHGNHFSEPHTYLGGLTILFVVSTPILGYMQFKIHKRREMLRNLHRWWGRITLILILLTILGGLLLAGII